MTGVQTCALPISHLYSWNLTGDGSLRPVRGVRLHTREPQCSDYLAIRGHLRLFESTAASHYHFALNWSLILPRGDLASLDTQALRWTLMNITGGVWEREGQTGRGRSNYLEKRGRSKIYLKF